MSGSSFRNIGPTAIFRVRGRRSDICLEGRIGRIGPIGPIGRSGHMSCRWTTYVRIELPKHRSDRDFSCSRKAVGHMSGRADQLRFPDLPRAECRGRRDNRHNPRSECLRFFPGARRSTIGFPHNEQLGRPALPGAAESCCPGSGRARQSLQRPAARYSRPRTQTRARAPRSSGRADNWPGE